jgi:hypothetical protein
MHLIICSDFTKGLNSTRKYYTKNEYFPMSILFSIIYLLQGQELNPRIYSKQELIMSIFVQSIEQGRKMHARFQDLILHRFL